MKIRSLALFLGALLFLSCSESSSVNPAQAIIETEATATTFTETILATSTEKGLVVSYNEMTTSMSYLEGDSLESNYDSFSIIYSDGTSSYTIKPSLASISGISSNSTVGKYIALVDYSGYTDIVDVYVATPNLIYETSISGGETIYKVGENSSTTVKNIVIPRYSTSNNLVTSIGKAAFDLNNSIESITVLDNITSIEESAFYKCSVLESVILGENVISIADKAFGSCSKLTTIKLSSSLKSIGRAAFNVDKALTSIEFPKTLEKIDTLAFTDCSGLKSISIYDNFDPNNLKNENGKTPFTNLDTACVVTIKDADGNYSTALKTYFEALNYFVTIE